ncbi:MAG: hypothetical protein HDKAJFGB_02673 [Anaerolineae bacterium]|nr:hypothetical protein [Anaerolineae bacterium]
MFARFLFDNVLHLGVERGVHLQARVIGIRAVSFLQLLPHIFDKVRRARVIQTGAAIVDKRRAIDALRHFLRRRRRLRGRQDALLLHQTQHHALAFERAVGIDARVVNRGQLRQTREQRRFRQIQLRHIFLKIGLRGGLDAVRMIAEVDSVEIERENFIFGISPRDFECENGFFDFAFDGLFGRKQRGLDELLRNGGRAADRALIAHEIINRARETIKIHAGVGVKRRVFGRQRRLFQHGRNFAGRNNRMTTEIRVGDFVQQRAVTVIDFGGLRSIDGRQFIGGRQFVGVIKIRAARERESAAHEK